MEERGAGVGVEGVLQQGFVTAKLAERTGFGEGDLELLFEAGQIVDLPQGQMLEQGSKQLPPLEGRRTHFY